MFRSLRYRNFRLFFIGQSVSFCGTWMQSTAQYWLVYRLTKDPFMLGLTAVAGQFPVFLLGLFAGSQVDQWDHLKLFRFTQSMALLQACAMATAVWSGRVTVWEVIALAFVLGLINAFDLPARQVLVGELVGAAHRHNAIALDSTIVNGSRIIGPALAGLAIAWLGEGWCFAINAASFVAVLIALFQIRSIRQSRVTPTGDPVSGEIRRGLSYISRRVPIRTLLIVLAVYTIGCASVYILQPVLAEATLHAGPKGFGWLSAAAGLGAFFGALHLARRPNAEGLGELMARSLFLFSGALLGLAFSRSLAISCALFSVVGWAAIQISAGANALLQHLVSDEFRGRVMSSYSMIIVGLAPVGSFLAGALAARLGAPRTMLGQSFISLALATTALRRLPDVLKAMGPLPAPITD